MVGPKTAHFFAGVKTRIHVFMTGLNRKATAEYVTRADDSNLNFVIEIISICNTLFCHITQLVYCTVD